MTKFFAVWIGKIFSELGIGVTQSYHCNRQRQAKLVWTHAGPIDNIKQFEDRVFHEEVHHYIK